MKEWKEWLIDNIKNNIEKYEQEKYFKDKLWENNDSFILLKKLAEEWIYSWEVIEKK